MRRLLTLALALLLAVTAWGQGGYNAFQNTSYSAVAFGNIIPENSLIKYHQLIWTTSGTVSTCQVSLDSSPDGTTWTVGGAIVAQTCTANGSSVVTQTAANFLRVNVSTLSGGGSIAIVYEGWVGVVYDNGSTFMYNGTNGLAATSITATGSCNTGTGGCLKCTEGSLGTVAAGTDILQCDSVNHKLRLAVNGGNAHTVAPFEIGTCTLSSGTCTFTFQTTYVSAPICTTGITNTGTFTTGAKLTVAPATNNVVATSSTGTDTAVIHFICAGNPN